MPGSDSSLLETQLLRDLHVDFAILLMLHPRPRMTDPSLDSAICAAHNEWLAATWLSKYNWHGRYKGSIRICPYDPDAAVREIEKWAGHPHVVQVSIFPETSTPFGQPQFLPIMRAAASHRLPVAMHIIKQHGIRALTPVGFPSYWSEVFAAHPLLFMSHLASLVFNGTFELLPDLRIVCVEGGSSWMAPFLWRMDKHWRWLGSEVPNVRKPPSEYIERHVRLTTQPMEEARYQAEVHRLMRWMNAGKILMLSTDYPHYDEDKPEWTLPRLPREMTKQIACENAIELYGLPRTRPRDALDAAS